VKTFARTAATNQIAFFWANPQQSGAELTYWNDLTSRKVMESRLDLNPPRAAQVYALESVAEHDVNIACWDAKYTYWRIRPSQLDPEVKVLFPTVPNHPSYPSAHSCNSGTAAAVLGSIFPADAAELNRLAVEAGNSRLWAGIHFQSDLEAGLNLAHEVAQAVLDSGH
jgi:hypothetical protein